MDNELMELFKKEASECYPVKLLSDGIDYNGKFREIFIKGLIIGAALYCEHTKTED